MDADERCRIEQRLQIRKRLFLQKRSPARSHGNVVVLRFEKINPPDRNHMHIRAVADEEALERGVTRPGGRD